MLIPVAKAQTFKQNLAQLPYEDRVDLKRYHEETVAQVRHHEDRVSPHQYKVKSGESLAAIADKNRTTVKSIRQTNHLAANSVRAGTILKIPAQDTSDDDATITAKASKNNTRNTQVYVVKKGDTFWNIGQRFSVSGADIAEWNNITSKTALVLGQRLIIKAGKEQQTTFASSAKVSSKESAAQRSISYTVKQGDSLAQISRKFNVSIADLRKWNSPDVSKSLTPGKKLKVIVKTT